MFKEFQIDHIFCVNLKRRPERLQFFKNQLANSPIEAEIFTAVDGKELSLKPPHDMCWGAVGCAMSHLDIFRLALRRGYEKIMVMEDDCCFEGKERRAADFLRSIDHRNPDLVAFGRGVPKGSVDMGGYYLSDEFIGTHCYVISRRLMKLVLSHNYEIDYPIDITLHIDFFIGKVARIYDMHCHRPIEPILLQHGGLARDNRSDFPTSIKKDEDNE